MGAVRVHQASEALGSKVNIRWRSFLLRTEPKTPSGPEGREKFARYTQSWGRPAEMEPEANFSFPWSSDSEPPSSSIPAQVAAKAVTQIDPAAFADFRWGLFDSYFTNNQTISDWNVLRVVASQAGIDAGEFDRVIEADSQRLAQQVIAEHNEAITVGVTAVPTVVVADVLPIPGAQDADTYIRLVERYIERRALAD